LKFLCARDWSVEDKVLITIHYKLKGGDQTPWVFKSLRPSLVTSKDKKSSGVHPPETGEVKGDMLEMMFCAERRELQRDSRMTLYLGPRKFNLKPRPIDWSRPALSRT